MIAETKPDPDVIVLRRVLAAAKRKRTRTHHRSHLDHWIAGKHDATPYFQAGLAEMKECRKEGLIG